MPEGKLDVTCADKRALLVARDMANRVVAAGIGKVTIDGEAGIYQLKTHVPGRQVDKLVAVMDGEQISERITGPASRSVIPSPDNEDAQHLWKESSFAKDLAGRERGRDGLSHEVVAGVEVPVEPAVGQPGLVHQFGHAHAVDPVTPHPT